MATERVYCPEAGRKKYLFPSLRLARSFMSRLRKNWWGGTSHRRPKQETPRRAYYCRACKGWHVTHITAAPKTWRRLRPEPPEPDIRDYINYHSYERKNKTKDTVAPPRVAGADRGDARQVEAEALRRAGTLRDDGNGPRQPQPDGEAGVEADTPRG
ncbi:MAG: hypothetical protein LUC33_03100 [Prevotellaceae bacterium]|nr:hypothetical protein [Prevotellaceae bacterium]